MAYEVWILDETGASTKLDTDKLDLTATFSVAEVSDITARKDTITKSVIFQGTKTNNEAFGSHFMFNKTSDSSLSDKVGFNYNPLRPVDCLVYENGVVILKGDIRLMSVTPWDKKGNTQYETVITGKLIEFKGNIQDALLTDIDFTDLKHPYHIDVIKDSASISTRSYDITTNTFSVVPFQKGKGYIYGHIDYGTQFQDNSNNNTANTDTQRFNALNYRPGVYVKEIFDRIFKAAGGFNYEMKGDAYFQGLWNSLFVPNGDEIFQSVFNGFNMKFAMPLPLVVNQSSSEHTLIKLGHFIPINNVTNPPANTISPYLKLYNGTNNIIATNRGFKSDARAGIVISGIFNHFALAISFKVALVEAPVGSNPSALNITDFKAVQEKTFIIAPGSPLPDQIINFSIPEREFENQKLYAVRIYAGYLGSLSFGPPIVSQLTYSVDACEVSFPKDALTQFTAHIKFDDTGLNPDIVVPTLPAGIKQIDFIKSVMQLFNLYCYSYKDNPRKLYFEKYDDYYALASPYYIVANSLNWTNKIDMSTLKRKSKLDLPKKYQFTYKEDSDWINDDYKKKYNTIYGTYQSTDSFGVVDSKQVQLIFSASPVIEPAGTQRLMPALYKVDSGNKAPSKTNIRILIYDAVRPCADYLLQKDIYDTTTSTWTTLSFNELTDYPRCSTFYYDVNGVPQEDLNFGLSNEYYFSFTPDYLAASNAYQNYYRDQITELTNPNISILECDAHLNELDIANLDLKIPVFIDTGRIAGHSYFKVLIVDYNGNDSLSKLTLQQVYLGTDR